MSQPAEETGAQGAAEPLTEAAFEAFYARTSAGLWRYLRRMSNDPELAEDLTQESYVKLLLKSDRAVNERQRIAYLYRIGTNLLRDRWRRRKREAGFLERLFSSEEPVTRGAPRVELRSDLDAVLGEMKPRERALVWLAHVEEYDHQEIGAILEVNPASVRVMLFRARRRLAKLLDERGLGNEERVS